MFLLDTNVVSELMKDRPEPTVLAWLDLQLTERLFVTSITEAEVRSGIAMLPEGQRKSSLAGSAERVFSKFFGDRVLPFDSDSAQEYAKIWVSRRSAGRPISQSDCQIAAIARHRGARVVTRNVSDFQGPGIDVVNPWSTDHRPGGAR